MLGLAAALLLGAGSAEPRAMPAPSATTPGPGVAEVLANPPAAAVSVELDAYFGGAGAPVLPGSGRRGRTRSPARLSGTCSWPTGRSNPSCSF